MQEAGQQRHLVFVDVLCAGFEAGVQRLARTHLVCELLPPATLLRLSRDSHDLVPPPLTDVEDVKNPHDLVQVRPDVPVLNPADALTSDTASLR